MDTRGTFPSVRLIEGVRWIGVCYKGKYQDDAYFGSRLNVHLIEGVLLIGGPLSRGFTATLLGCKSQTRPCLFSLICDPDLAVWLLKR